MPKKTLPPEVIEPAQPAAKTGRPGKLTPEVADRIELLVKGGNRLVIAARVAGVSKATLMRWMQRGRKEKAGIYRDFRDRIRAALAVAEAAMVTTIRLAAQGSGNRPGDAKMALAWLERRVPKHWSQSQRLQAQISGGPKPVKVEVQEMTLAEVQAERKRLRKKRERLERELAAEKAREAARQAGKTEAEADAAAEAARQACQTPEDGPKPTAAPVAALAAVEKPAPPTAPRKARRTTQDQLDDARRVLDSIERQIAQAGQLMKHPGNDLLERRGKQLMLIDKLERKLAEESGDGRRP